MINQTIKSQAELEKEESLSLEYLKQIQCSELVTSDKISSRPIQSYIELINWVDLNFSSYLKDKSNLNKFVHNRIVMDGQFLTFAKENKIDIKCLYKDSIISWRTSTDQEKFFAQGVFLIKAKNVEFIHSALFHKGNQNEDEISFCVLVSEKNLDAYLQIRNSFDDWVTQRDRSNSYVRVVGADDMPYDTDHSWSDLYLPEDIKTEIRSVVESFLSSKDFYEKNKIPWKTGIILSGPPGNGKSSIIKTIISNYNFKPVTIVPTADDAMIREAFMYAEEQSPSLLYFEDLDSLLERNIDLSSFLNLMDGITSRHGIMVIATANEVHKLKSSIIDRPSRFDRKFEIPLPNEKMAYIYLSRWFGKNLSTTKLKELSKLSVKYEFSYAYLKELYISSMFQALSSKRKSPTEKDVNLAVNRLMKDKNIYKQKQISINQYFER